MNEPTVWTPDVRVGDVIEAGQDRWRVVGLTASRTDRRAKPARMRIVIEAEIIDQHGGGV